MITHSVDQYKNEKVYTIGTEKTQINYFNTSGWGDIKLYRTLFKSNTPDVSALQGYQQFLDTSGRDMKRTALIKSFIEQDIKESSTSAAVGSDAETLLSLYGVSSINSTIPLTTQKFNKISEQHEADISIYTYNNDDVLPILSSP